MFMTNTQKHVHFYSFSYFHYNRIRNLLTHYTLVVISARVKTPLIYSMDQITTDSPKPLSPERKGSGTAFHDMLWFFGIYDIILNLTAYVCVHRHTPSILHSKKKKQKKTKQANKH